MSQPIAHGEAWLLETLAMFPVPVWCLTRNEQALRNWLNRGHHGLDIRELARTLRRMFGAGDLEVFRKGDPQGHRPTDPELSAALKRQDRDLHCQVSEQGGRRWERLAAPDWSRYFEDRCWDEQSVTLTAGSHDRLIELIENAEVLWRAKPTDPSRVAVQSLRPWEALSWKTLAEGFRADVPYRRVPWVPTSREEAITRHQQERPRQIQLRGWATSICGQPFV